MRIADMFTQDLLDLNQLLPTTSVGSEYRQQMRIQILILGLKGLKWHHSSVRSKKTAAVFIEDEAFAVFFRLTARNLAAEVSPSLGICNPRQKR